MKRALLAAFTTTLLMPATAFAGGWTQPRGASYHKVWMTGLFGENLFDVDGALVDTPTFNIASLSVYGEHGLRDDLTMVAALQPLGVANYNDQTRAFMGKMLLGFRQRFASGPANFALEARFGGSPGFGGGRDMAPDADHYVFKPSVRSLVSEWELQLGVPLPFGWATASFGPRWYASGALDPEVFGFAQVGFGPFTGFVLDVHATYNHSFGELEVANLAGAGNTRYAGLGLGVSWWITDAFAVNAAADGAIFARSNTGAPALSVGVEFR